MYLFTREQKIIIKKDISTIEKAANGNKKMRMKDLLIMIAYTQISLF